DFTADFGAQKLTGNLANSSLSVTVNANIATSSAAFNGTALANGATRGVAKGHFFGADAASLAGIATFANRQLDTAFGGTKK
ncbi:transferrin-binding protein-like solute binding protein, partial [Cutibacterium acnes]